MEITLVEEPASIIAELARIPIAFEVDRVFDVDDSGETGRYVLSERRIDKAFVKDYDSLPGNNPRDWTKDFDLTNWGVIGAYAGAVRVGAAVIVYDTGGITIRKTGNPYDTVRVEWLLLT